MVTSNSDCEHTTASGFGAAAARAQAPPDRGRAASAPPCYSEKQLEDAEKTTFHDITDEDSPLEAGLDFTVKFDKPGGFIGKDALLKQREAGLRRRLVQFKLEDPEPLLYHNEPIWRDDKIVGHITSGAYGHTLGGCVGLGYVHTEPGASDDDILGGNYEIEVATERFAAEASLSPMYDPGNEKIRR